MDSLGGLYVNQYTKNYPHYTNCMSKFTKRSPIVLEAEKEALRKQLERAGDRGGSNRALKPPPEDRDTIVF